MSKCKHEYANVLIHSTDPFWGDEFFLGERCQLCGKTLKGNLPMKGWHFLSPAETLDKYNDLEIIEDIEREPPDLSYGSVAYLGYNYSLWWEPVTAQWDGYVIRHLNGEVLKSWIVKEVK